MFTGLTANKDGVDRTRDGEPGRGWEEIEHESNDRDKTGGILYD